MAMPVHATTGQRVWRVTFLLICLLGFLFLVGPIIAIIPIAFSAGSHLNYPLPGLSLRWFEEIFIPYPWMMALKNSLLWRSHVGGARSPSWGATSR